MESAWAAVAVALVVGTLNLAVTLGLDWRRQRERAAQRKIRDALEAFEADVRAPLRDSLHDLERLSTKILQAAGHTTGSERERAARHIFENEKTQVLASFDRPLASARLWSRDSNDMYLGRLRDLELQIDRTLAQLVSRDLTTTHRISESSRQLSDEVRGFSTACRLWLYEISEALSSERLKPPAKPSTQARDRSTRLRS
jgi:hypothetical protein